MTDKHTTKASDIMDEACLGEPFVSNGVVAALRASIESALRSAAAEEREAILKDISTIELSESKDRVSPKKTYSLGDLWEAYYTGAHALHNAAIQLIRSRGITND